MGINNNTGIKFIKDKIFLTYNKHSEPAVSLPNLDININFFCCSTNVLKKVSINLY